MSRRGARPQGNPGIGLWVESERGPQYCSSIIKAAIYADVEPLRLGNYRRAALASGASLFGMDGRIFYLVQPTPHQVEHADRVRGAGPLLSGLCTHGLGQLWR